MPFFKKYEGSGGSRSSISLNFQLLQPESVHESLNQHKGASLEYLLSFHFNLSMAEVPTSGPEEPGTSIEKVKAPVFPELHVF